MSASAACIHLIDRPAGVPETRHFKVRSVPLAPLRSGEVLVENRYLSIDPYMRGRMDDRPSYYAPWPLDEPVDGDAVGVVVTSAASNVPEGSWVASDYGLRDRFVAPAVELRLLGLPPVGHDHAVFLDLLGGTGFTAYLGVGIIRPEPGQTVFITTVAGAVGSAASQLCAAKGAAVVGSTSTDEKVELAVNRYKAHRAFNYREQPVAEALAELAPYGIDGMFDNVGSDQLEAALDAMNIGGRIAKCGDISSYNAVDRPAGPRNLSQFFAKRLTMQGFLVSDHKAERPAFEREMRRLIESGEVLADRHIVQGLDHAVELFSELFSGHNVGKTIVGL